MLPVPDVVIGGAEEKSARLGIQQPVWIIVDAEVLLHILKSSHGRVTVGCRQTIDHFPHAGVGVRNQHSTIEAIDTEHAIGDAICDVQHDIWAAWARLSPF